MLKYINSKIRDAKLYIQGSKPVNYNIDTIVTKEDMLYIPEDGFSRAGDKKEYHSYDSVETDHCPCNAEFNTHTCHQMLRDENNL